MLNKIFFVASQQDDYFYEQEAVNLQEIKSLKPLGLENSDRFIAAKLPDIYQKSTELQVLPAQ